MDHRLFVSVLFPAEVFSAYQTFEWRSSFADHDHKESHYQRSPITIKTGGNPAGEGNKLSLFATNGGGKEGEEEQK